MLAACLLGVCFIVTQYVLPHVSQPSAQINLTDAGERQLLRLRKNVGDGHVYALNVHIRGKLNGTAKIRMFDDVDSTKILQEKIIGSGEVDTKMGGDWYTNDCRMEYEPMSATQGGIKIEYRFKTSGKTKKGA